MSDIPAVNRRPQRWAQWVIKYAWLWMMGWAIAAVGLWVFSPRISTLLADNAQGFLPPDMPSQRAFAQLRAEFPDRAPASRAAIVIHREPALTENDRQFLSDVAMTLASRSDTLLWRIHAAATAPWLAPLLESPDRQAAVIGVDLPAEFLTHSAVNRVREIQRTIAEKKPPSGLVVEVTGAAALGELLDANAKRDVDRTTLWTFAALAAILLIIYRSPTAMLLPLLTVAPALMISLGLVGWAAKSFLPISGLLQMFMVVVLAGCGVDYCLLLFARFREEHGRGLASHDALKASLAHSGKAILVAGATNAIGLATLILARNRSLHSTGPTIAFSLAVVTLCAMSLTPALMHIAGRSLFWPHRATRPDQSENAFWKWLGFGVTRHPVLFTLLGSVILLPFAWFGLQSESVYDSYEMYPAKSSFVQGARLYQDHFFGGRAVSELSLVITSTARLTADEHREALKQTLNQTAEAMAKSYPVLYQRDLADPLGKERNPLVPERPARSPALLEGFTDRAAGIHFLGTSGKAMRIDLGLAVDPRSIGAFEMLPHVKQTLGDSLGKADFGKILGGADFEVHAIGDTAMYADMRQLRKRDFRVVAAGATAVIFLILYRLTRSSAQALVLIAATLVVYLATYGITKLIFQWSYGIAGLGWQIDFLLFIIMLSLGQDYNIFVIARMQEEWRTRTPDAGVAEAVHRTGRVVSSCGLIMAATFASMFSGSLLIMKQFAVALSLGILIDTFVVRPMLVPAAILLLERRKRKSVAPAPPGMPNE